MKTVPIISASLVLFLQLPGVAFAQSVTPSASIASPAKIASPSSSISPTKSVSDDVNTLKEKVANKVAELQKKNNKAAAGFVTSIKDEQIVITDRDDQKRTVKIDQVLTKYYQISGTTKKELKFENISKGDYIIISGPMIGDVLTANVIYVDERLDVLSGKVAEVDSDNMKIKVVTTDKDTYSVSVSPPTKLFLVDSKSLETGRATISKMKEGDTVHFVYSYKPDAKDKLSVNALKVVVIPQEYFQR